MNLYGTRFRAARQAAGLTLREVAERIGTTPQGVHQVEAKGRPSLETAVKYADVYDVSLDYFAGREGMHQGNEAARKRNHADLQNSIIAILTAELEGLKL